MKATLSIAFLFFIFSVQNIMANSVKDSCNCSKNSSTGLGWVCYGSGNVLHDENGKTISNFQVIKRKFSGDSYENEDVFSITDSVFGNSGSTGDWHLITIRKTGYQDLYFKDCLSGLKLTKNKKIGRDGDHFYYSNGDIYIGSFSTTGKRDGEGIYIWKSGSFYKGTWKEDNKVDGIFFGSVLN